METQQTLEPSFPDDWYSPDHGKQVSEKEYWDKLEKKPNDEAAQDREAKEVERQAKEEAKRRILELEARLKSMEPRN